MAKAILELPEMPKSCAECPCKGTDVWGMVRCRLIHIKSDKYSGMAEGYTYKRREDCPLKLVKGKEVEADFKQIDKKWECNKCKRGCVSFNGKTFAVNGLVGSGEGFVWLNPGEYAPCGYLVEDKEVEHDG